MTSNKKRILKLTIFILFITLLWVKHKLSTYYEYNPITSIAISQNGNHIVTTSYRHDLTLWDLKTRSSKLVYTHANIYSAYFIAKTDEFIWQSQPDNIVHLTNIENKEKESLKPGFSSYGELYTNDLRSYIASDKNWYIYTRDL